MGYSLIVLTMMALLQGCEQQQLNPHIEIVNKQILNDGAKGLIYDHSKLSKEYNDTIFLSQLSCRNDDLEIINNTKGTQIVFQYTDIPTLTKNAIKIQISPNQQPIPYISSVTHSNFVLNLNCSESYTSNSYFNLITVNLVQNITFSFLLNCDPSNRHKKFQIGYLLISLMNAVIIVGVAMHSHVWSIKINLRPLRFELQWIPFLIISIIAVLAITLFMRFSYSDYKKVFQIIQYVGVGVSIPYIFLCFNQILFLFNKLKTRLYKFIRICDLISLALTIVVATLAFIYQNWIFYDLIAACICVGSIKMFHFKSLKLAFISMIIMIAAITILTTILHFIVPLSYNDYAGELSSPFFFQVPDLVNNLYKKCSWLPIFDVIIPGVTLSYLRVYDQNQSSKWGGVYTVSGNLVFVIATAIWIGVEYIYPFSVPFSLITYPILMMSIFVISWRRNEWLTLVHGRFEQGYNTIDQSVLQQSRRSFGEHVDSSSIQDLLITSENGKNPCSSNLSN